MEEAREDLPDAAMTPGRVVVVFASEDPGGAVEQRTVQLEDEASALNDVDGRLPERRPLTGEGALDQVVDARGEHGLETGSQRGESLGHPGNRHILIVEHALDEDGELRAPENLLGNGE